MTGAPDTPAARGPATPLIGASATQSTGPPATCMTGAAATPAKGGFASVLQGFKLQFTSAAEALVSSYTAAPTARATEAPAT